MLSSHAELNSAFRTEWTWFQTPCSWGLYDLGRDDFLERGGRERTGTRTPLLVNEK